MAKSNTADRREKPRPKSKFQFQSQRLWRRGCLLARMAAGTMISKNWNEAANLGLADKVAAAQAEAA